MPTTRLTREERLRRVREYLATRDVPCPMCRYNLRGLEDPTCPECGFGFDDVTIRLLDPLNRHGPIRALHSDLMFWIAVALNVIVAVAMFWGRHDTLPAWLVPMDWTNQVFTVIGILSFIETVLPGSVASEEDSWEIFVEYGTTLYVVISLVTCAILAGYLIF